MTNDEIQKIAHLARIDLPEGEMESLKKDFESIIEYIGQIDQVTIPDNIQAQYTETNVMREDVGPIVGNTYTQDILAEAPDREGDLFRVPKVL